MTQRNLIIITKIILFYSIFFIGVKLFVLFQGAWIIPNLLLAFPFLILALIAGYLGKTKNYSWTFVALGAVIIILIRILESRLVHWIQEQITH